MAPNRQKQQRIGVAPELVKEFTVELIRDGKTVASANVRDNHLRHRKVGFPAIEADTVKITPVSTNGSEEVVIHEVRIY
jgi:hypothetical protein